MTRLSKVLATASCFAVLLVLNFSVAGVVRADPVAEGISFTVTNLDSNVGGRAAFTDPNTQNAWGIAFAPGSPFWVNDNHAGVSTLYAGDGSIIPLVVTIPPPLAADPGTLSSPTGMVWNPTQAFHVPGTTLPGVFIFDTEDGTISAWNGGATLGSAVIAVDISPNAAVYKGLAFGTNATGNHLYATNFYAGEVEVFDNQFHPVTVAGGFMDHRIPPGFAPFGIQNIDGDLWVSYAMQDAFKHDDVGGPGSGFVDVFDTDGHLLRRFARHGALNSPWGLARAPYGFGPLSGAILIGNFKDGRINAFDAHGHLLGALRATDGMPIQIDGLWAISFGGGAKSSPESLYFTAGPDGETNGVFGVINAVPHSPD